MWLAAQEENIHKKTRKQRLLILFENCQDEK
jgi:hypothetical protein